MDKKLFEESSACLEVSRRAAVSNRNDLVAKKVKNSSKDERVIIEEPIINVKIFWEEQASNPGDLRLTLLKNLSEKRKMSCRCAIGKIKM